jgi:hypothetical protein
MTPIVIDLFRMETGGILKTISEYQSTIESQLKSVQENEQKKLEDWMLKIKAESEDWYQESDMAQDEYFWTYQYMFPRTLRYSFIVLLFLVFENQLKSLCDILQERRNFPLRANELYGDPLARNKKYIKKMVGITDIDEKLWEKVEDLSKVRDCIVHSLGKIELSKKPGDLHNIVKKSSDLSISSDDSPEEGLLIISQGYCRQAVIDVQNLFTAIFESAGYRDVINTS